MYCVHCGLPARSDCDHEQSAPRRHQTVIAKKERTAEQSIHPRVRNGRTVSPKVNTAKANKNGK